MFNKNIDLEKIFNNSKNIYEEMLVELNDVQIYNHEQYKKHWINIGVNSEELIEFDNKKGWWKWWELLIPKFQVWI